MTDKEKYGPKVLVFAVPIVLVLLWLLLRNIEYCVMVDGSLPGDGCQAMSFWSRFILSPPNEIGDTLAGVFGSLAFLVAAIAVFMQSRELAAQREELKLTREENERQRKATQKLAEIAADQLNREHQEDVDRQISSLERRFSVDLLNDYENSQSVVWAFQPLASGKFGAQNKPELSLPKLKLVPSDHKFLADVSEKLESFLHELLINNRHCRAINLPSGEHYKFRKSSISYLKIRSKLWKASKAKVLDLENSLLIKIGKTIDDINEGDWWYER